MKTCYNKIKGAHGGSSISMLMCMVEKKKRQTCHFACSYAFHLQLLIELEQSYAIKHVFPGIMVTIVYFCKEEKCALNIWYVQGGIILQNIKCDCGLNDDQYQKKILINPKKTSCLFSCITI